jgi:hypothetical protein
MKHRISKWLEGRSTGHASFAWSVLAQLAQVGKDSTHTWQEAKMQYARCRLKCR